ncbi:hypothetical protein vseg_001235 [Gypsophila vaccaria]
MGAQLSGLLGSKPNHNGPGIGLGDLPENCVAMILGRLGPQEICRFAIINKTFYWASLSNVVWGSKLPSNYEFLLGNLFSGRPKQVGKRDIYRVLCGPIRFDVATKEIWMEKSSGKMFMSISWKGLKITGINDRRYWSHIPTEESRFHSVAYLQQVWWLEAEGEIEFNFPVGTYSVFFRLQIGKTAKSFGRRVCNLDHAHGWATKPVRFQLSVSNGHCVTSECVLKEFGNWKNYHAGNFTVGNHHVPVKIKFSMAQVDCTHTKGGLCLDSVLICPCDGCESAE